MFVFRAVHSKSFMPFNLKAYKIFANTVIVILQIIFMVLSLPYNALAQVIIVVLICTVNARSILSALKKVLKKIIKI